ncbi:MULTISPECIES: hypothetical protein [Sphingobacterium]|uniref:hypothetical protein n=1 Tax=Sphingobacterium TaxID=28453 RepID=UPI002580F9E2|nr:MULTISPECIES: hypothetical protein [Sphingobacterium]
MEQKTIMMDTVNGFDSWYKTFVFMLDYAHQAKDWYDTISYYYQVDSGEAGLIEMALDYTNYFEKQHREGWKNEDERNKSLRSAMRVYEYEFHSY